MAQTHKIMLSSKPANIHQRMVSRHNHGTRTAAGVTRGFGGQKVKRSFNFSASEYNKLKKWVQDNILETDSCVTL